MYFNYRQSDRYIQFFATKATVNMNLFDAVIMNTLDCPTKKSLRALFVHSSYHLQAIRLLAWFM